MPSYFELLKENTEKQLEFLIFVKIKKKQMRIIGYLDTKGYKTTVFKNNDRFIVKFEADLLEQTFKFRESAKISSLKDIKALVDPAFLKTVEDRFKNMHADSFDLLQRFHDFHEDDWIEII